MVLGGVLAQTAVSSGDDLDRVIRSLVGQALGVVAVIVFAVWMMRRSRRNRAHRPPPSGWYPDPWGGPYERWWNGTTWTGNVRANPAAPPWPGADGPPWGAPPGGSGGPPGP